VRYGVFGDVHSNLEALNAVASALETEDVDALLCPGDIVGYGASPKECLDIVREMNPVLVAGNHDWAACGRLGLEYFNQYARDAILWTRKALTREDSRFLSQQPLLRVSDSVTLAHGTIHDPEMFEYLQTPYDAHMSFSRLSTPFGFVGHSHIPVTFRSGTTISYVVGEEITLREGIQSISNVGSVGQPRDEDPRAAYGVFDDQTRVLLVKRVEYDVESAIDRIRRAGLPDFLGERLRIGR
jgi:diadenosine tetraphosphatase ApaH/serine/threonine PP2A family protein phosphatase